MPADWNPEQYHRFAAQRAQPFHDLLALIRPGSIGRAVDLGCGPGELTALAVEQLQIGQCTGIDISPAMLARTAEHAGPHLQFESGDIGAWTSGADIDLVLAAASLQWVPDHPAVIARWTAALARGGQLAVQVPANAHMPAHLVIQEVASRPEYADEFGADGPPADPVAVNVLEPEEYAQLLFDLGFVEQHVRLEVYPHVLPSTHHIVEWVRGTTMTRIEKRLAPDVFRQFLVDYDDALQAVLGDNEPQFFPFRRILMWGRQP